MHIAVCLCQVPDTSSVISFVEGVIDFSRVNEMMNPYDEYALEEAVSLKERFEGSVVTLFCVAPPSARESTTEVLPLDNSALLFFGWGSSSSDSSSEVFLRPCSLR